MTSNTSPKTPPEQTTDEATKEGLRLAKQVGDAYEQMVEYFIENVAVSGAKQEAGEYIVGFAVEHAEPLYKLCGGQLRLAEPAEGDNAHLEVVVMDRDDKRFIPELEVHVTLTDTSGHEVGTFDLPFLWHPTMYHYGRNIRVPSGGTYAATIYIEVPSFARHDKVNGNRYTRPVITKFDNVQITTGRK